MQRRIRASTLQENAYGTSYPSPVVRVLDMSPLSGGLNLWELDYRLDKSQSPDTVNMYWKDGCLTSRPGQAYIYDPSSGGNYGDFYACYDRPWNGKIIAHKGTHLYAINPDSGVHTLIYAGTLSTNAGGTFFVFRDKLYYMNGAQYIQITSSLVASDVVGYIPTVVMGMAPDGTGGDLYQDENRLSAGKTIQYTQKAQGSEASVFTIPSGYTPLDNVIVSIKANGHIYHEYVVVNSTQEMVACPITGQDKGESGASHSIWYKRTDYVPAQYWKKEGSVYTQCSADDLADYYDLFTVDREHGEITFDNAPSQTVIQTPNNVTVTFYSTNYVDPGKTIPISRTVLGCSCVTVYGGETNLAVVCGGNSLQPNVYFWSGSTAVGLDPTYFPFDNYNYAGSDSSEYITGFGKQQNMLVIFKQRSIGKSFFDIPETSGKEYLNLKYKPINDTIGCDIEGSIRLVQNNLVFANTYGGVYVLLDTTAAGENTVTRISRNVNGDGETKGLLYDLRKLTSTTVSSFDDDQRYWLVANGHAYLWDYTLRSFRSNEGTLSWFYFENINARGWYKDVGKSRHFVPNGGLVDFVPEYNDFGEVIPRKYVFATQFFDTYEVLKEVMKVVFAVRTDDDPAMTITYKTDYEERNDLTPIYAYAWRLYPRNLSHRSLRPIPFAFTAVRIPRTFHVRHFQMAITNNTINTGMSIVSAQIFYRFNKEDR